MCVKEIYFWVEIVQVVKFRSQKSILKNEQSQILFLKITSIVDDADELKESRDLIKRIREFECQTTILKMLLKNNGIPVNREGESED